jgi:hypothetical protein
MPFPPHRTLARPTAYRPGLHQACLGRLCAAQASPPASCGGVSPPVGGKRTETVLTLAAGDGCATTELDAPLGLSDCRKPVSPTSSDSGVAFQEALCGKDSGLNPVEDDEAVEGLPNPPRARSNKVRVGRKSLPPDFRIPRQNIECRIHGLGEASGQRQRLCRIEICFQQVPAKPPFQISVETL